MHEVASMRRDSVGHFLEYFSQIFGAPDDTEPPAMRHLAVAGLNLDVEAGPDTLFAAGQALSWMALWMAWQRGDLCAQALGHRLIDTGLVRHLGPLTVTRRLAHLPNRHFAQVRRDPHDPSSIDESLKTQIELLTEIADDDRRVDALSEMETFQRRDHLFGDSGLLATALELRREDEISETARQVVALLPDWPIERSSPAVRLLARLENDNFDSIPVVWEQLSTGSQRFEMSLARHLERHGLLLALRVALAIAPKRRDRSSMRSQLRSHLTGITRFAEDRPLLELTMALIDMRQFVPAHLRGEVPLGSLSPWITYLRNRCADFAESREITLREATNFAHYTLHLMNIFDLTGEARPVLSDEIRKALMDVENELKEFALEGQRRALDDRQSDLAHYDRMRWRNEEPRAICADRLSRLCGAWRGGHHLRPTNGPPRPDHELYEQCLRLVRDSGDGFFDALADLLARMELIDPPRLDDWHPREVLALLRLVLTSLCRTESLDLSSPFRIDLADLTSWLEDNNAYRRQQMLRALISILDGGDSPVFLHDRSLGLILKTRGQTACIGFRPTPQLEALLTLADMPDSPDGTADFIRSRVVGFFEGGDVEGPFDDRCNELERTSPDPRF